MKNPLTQAGIEPATFRFVAQHLNHCATAVPKTVLRMYKISSASGALKIKHWPWDYLALILNLFILEHSQFLELCGYEDTRRWIPFCTYVYNEPFIHGKLGSSCVHHVLCCLHQNQSTLIFLCAFICRTERLQDFTERFSRTTLVNKAENQTAHPHKKGQKCVYVDGSSSKMVSNSEFYFYMTRYCYNTPQLVSGVL